MNDLTIITVVRDNLEGLRKTYQGLLAQANQDFDWLVIDGGSKDGSLQWLSSIEYARFRFVSGPDKSIFDAMNKGLSLSRTEYCLFLNGGDFFCDANVIESILNVIRTGPFKVAYGKYVLGSVPGFPDRVRGKRIRNRMELFYGPVPCHQTMLLSREAFAENGPYRLDVGIYGDMEWILRYSKLRHPSTFRFMPFIVSYYNPEGVSYLRFFTHGKTYRRILRENGNIAEVAMGLIGWLKAAAYVSISRMKRRISRSGA
jgi:glycosyltransferase involved in cell wall biosynthesis